MSKEFLELVGVVIGDGNIWSDGRHYRVEITGNPKKDVRYFGYVSNLVKKFTEEKVCLTNRSGGLRMRINSKEFYGKLTSFGFCQRKEKLRNLKFLENIPIKDRSHVLRGLVDTDGCVVRRSNGQVFMEICTTSDYLAKWADYSLKLLGFRCFVTSSVSKNSGKPIYRVWLSGKRNIEKWVTEIGFSNSYKLKKALEIISN